MKSTQKGVILPDDRVSVAYYKKIYDRVSTLGLIGAWECELETCTLLWTDAVYDLFEIPRGSPIERPDIVQMYEPESRARLEHVRSKAIADRTGFALDAQIRTRTGKLRWIRIIADIELENGRPSRIFGSKQDVTAERQAQDEIRLLQTKLIHVSRVHAMGTMASTLAHELNQPLTAIANYLLAARRLATPDSSPEGLLSCVEHARDSALRAGEIIRRLREMTINGHASREPFQLRTAIEEAVALASAGRTDLHVSCLCPAELIVIADRIQVQQVLLNLVQNSYEAADGACCRVQITVSEQDGEVEVAVADDGPGIRDDLLPFIFDSLVTTKDSGMGIGLSISRTIVETHGGRTTARNIPGGGACISFVLPDTLGRSELK